MLIFADEGGRGVSGNTDVIISSFEKGFFALERQKNIEKSLKKPKIIKETLKFPTFFIIFFKNSPTVLSSDKIITGEI